MYTIEYLTKIRTEKSLEYLKTTNMKTYEIAEKVGYNDPHYFSLIFKKIMSFTPSDYRNNL
ncbi:MAG: helix-turn-helix transcriptional regulator [Clostridiales bacterium]